MTLVFYFPGKSRYNSRSTDHFSNIFELLLLLYYTPSSSVSHVNFEQVNTDSVVGGLSRMLKKFKNSVPAFPSS